MASLAVSASRPQAVVNDLRMQGMDGPRAVRCDHTRNSPSLRWWILTAHGTIPEAVAANATRPGLSFLTKTI